MIDRASLVAFVSSGALWTAGASLGLRTGPVIAGMAAAYVLLGSWALARSAGRTGAALGVLWSCVVASISVVLFPVAGFFALVAGLLFGTLAFGIWVSTGFLMLHFFSRSRGTARP